MTDSGIEIMCIQLVAAGSAVGQRKERQSTSNDTDGLLCVVECVSLSQPLSNYLVIMDCCYGRVLNLYCIFVFYGMHLLLGYSALSLNLVMCSGETSEHNKVYAIFLV